MGVTWRLGGWWEVVGFQVYFESGAEALLIAQMWGRRGNPLPPPLNGVPSSQGQACYMWGVVDHDITRGIDRHLPTFISSATNGLDSIFHFETIFEFITICSIQWVCRLPSASCRRSSGRNSWDRISQCVPQCGGGPWCLAKEFLMIHSNGCDRIRFWKNNFLFNPVLLYTKRQSPRGGKSWVLLEHFPIYMFNQEGSGLVLSKQ